eukprot:CAMPEP_0168620114 /NCGR_PEP_ID=MMETSP0449_2-20121227/6961_1 /TAXON_ID=1082188 /ORGANISM="Strombidium rassoulzadegani, Strain ras09" /LENGTH=77 /DNA_ID=CAMNT_0008661091 /DNA_START=445 /DNA_END=679 /DNA_ORIENTATION=+
MTPEAIVVPLVGSMPHHGGVERESNAKEDLGRHLIQTTITSGYHHRESEGEDEEEAGNEDEGRAHPHSIDHVAQEGA